MKKILILRFDHIGDLLCSTPCIRALKKKYPQAQIDFVGSSRNIVAVENNPNIQNIYVLESKNILQTLKNIFLLRQQKYDMAFVLNSHSKTACIYASLLGIKNKIALGTPHKKFISLFTTILPVQNVGQVIEIFLNALKPLGIAEESTQMDYVVEPSILEWAKITYPKTLKFRLAIFIGNINKPHDFWGVENFVTLCDELLQNENLEICVWGGNAEKVLFPKFEKFTENPRFSIIQDLSFKQGAGFLLQCDALLICSTGPAHLAAALGVPVLSILNDYQAIIWRTLGEKDVFVCPENPALQVPDIPYAKVKNMVMEYLEKHAK